MESKINFDKIQFEYLNHVPTGILIIDSDYRVVFWNNTVSEWTNISCNNIVGESLFVFFPQLLEKNYKDRIDTIFQSGTPIFFSHQAHGSILPLFLSSGESRVHNTSVMAVPSFTEGEINAMFTIEDITELSHQISEQKRLKGLALQEIERRKLIENSFLESEFKLRELNASKDRFFSIIAHDIKGPISSFVILSEHLFRHFTELTEDEQVDMLSAMYSSTKQLYNLLENLLEWSRIQMGIIQVMPLVFKIHEAVAANITMLQPSALSKNISITSLIPVDSTVYCDSHIFNSIIRNLLTNSIKFTHHGGKVIISSSEVDNMNEICVEDNGVGIPMGAINKLFRLDEKYSTLGTDDEKGTGLGLILCKEFVEKSGGSIRVESEENSGSRFIIQLPLWNPILLIDDSSDS
ncbi:MAG: histidine kinase [Ignavibacteria bacterium]|nr:histidine kinase [Ignavibacteria bacterium]